MRALTALCLLVAALALSPAARAQEDRPDIVVAVDGLYRTLEPIDGNSTTGNRVFPNLFDQLVTRNFLEDPEGTELRPALAESWEEVDDRTWRFHLRQGVLFHNGEEMTAEDVAFSLSAERIWGEDALVPIGTRYTEAFESVEVVDEYTVDVGLSRHDPNLPYRFITALGYIVPRDHYLEVGPEQFGQAPVGTGPYRLVSFDSSDHVRLEAFDDYWGGTPPAASVEFRVVPEFSARLAGMVSGEFDIMVNVPADQVETVEGYDQLTYVARPLTNYVMLAYNTLDLPEFGDNPLADVDLRRAMTMAIDRDSLVEALWGDATMAPAPFNFPEFGAFYDPSIEPKYGYDPERAQEYLAQSGYDGEEIVINVTRGAFPNFDLAVEYAAEQWRAMGLNVRLNVVDSWALALQHPYGMLNMSMTTEFDGTPTRAIWGFWGPESARATREADRSWSPPEEFVALGHRYLEETDTEERVALFRQMAEIWEDVMPALIFWRNVASWVVQSDLEWNATNSVWMPLGPGFLTVER